MQRQFDIITDSCCGMPREFYEEHGITEIPLGYTLDGVSYGGGEGKALPLKEFYARLRAGAECHTFQVTAEPQLDGLVITHSFKALLPLGQNPGGFFSPNISPE